MRASWIFALCLFLSNLWAFQYPPSTPLDPYLFLTPDFPLSFELIALEKLPQNHPLNKTWETFIQEQGGTWKGWVDRRSYTLNLAEGSGIPWVEANEEPTLSLFERKARAFIQRYAAFFGVPPEVLRFNPEHSTQLAGYLHFLEYDVVFHDIPLLFGRVFFRINHGRLVQFGSEWLSPPPQPPSVWIDSKLAWDTLRRYLKGWGDPIETLKSQLAYLPLADPSQKGYAYPLVWLLTFRIPSFAGLYQAWVDAQNQEIYAVKDLRNFGVVQGGIYPNSPLDGETTIPFPFCDVSPVGTTHRGGGYTYPGGTVTSTLNGPYVTISDNCGSILLSTSQDPGDLDFGTSSGTDCTTPGFGGAGNTHASRNMFYHLNRIKEKGRSWLPGNTWLQGDLTANVNLNQTCNAYWNGSSVNFFKDSGSSCRNTGEIAGVAFHEYGHGLDNNDGVSPADYGTGEAYGDSIAVFQSHDSCIGTGFFKSQNCSGYGDACLNCSGIRDIDWAKHSSGTPHTPSNFIGPNCPSHWFYQGPCGKEGHCESYVISESIWDLAVRDLPSAGYDTATSWYVAERLFYLSRPTSGKAFECPSLSGSHGCGSSNWFTTFRVVDDDDGNLANGTPHADSIFSAFNRHAIACGSSGDPENQRNGCSPSLSAPTLNGSAGTGSISLSWSSVSGAASYDILRTEWGCSQGFIKIASTSTTSYTDTEVVPGINYSYRVVAISTNAACYSPLSNCITLSPSVCLPPASPTNLQEINPTDCQAIELTWDAVSGAAGYRVYRSTAGCGGSFTLLGSTTALTFTDPDVTAGITYAYQVTAIDSTGSCESSPSNCLLASLPGSCPCTTPPTFSGLASVSPGNGSSCQLSLSWVAGTPNCGNALHYNIYRSTSPGFTPSPANLLASCIAGTSYGDTSVVPGQTYYYIVRAEDDTSYGSGPCNGGNEDTNTVEKSGTAFSVIFWDDGGDKGNPQMVLGGSWAIRASGGHDQPRVYATSASGNYGNNLCMDLTTPEIQLPPATDAPKLIFWTLYDIELNWDAGEVQIAPSPYTNWTRLSLTPDYPNTLSNSGNACGLPTGYTYFTGSSSGLYYQYTADLSPWANQLIKIRFRFSSDGSVNYAGWFIDEIQVVQTCSPSCTAPGSPKDLTASLEVNQVHLTWTPPSGNPEASTYNIYRSDGSPCPGSQYFLIASDVPNPWYDDPSAMDGQTHSYKVTAVSASGCESAFSNCTSLTTCAIPSTPTSLLATPASPTSIDVTWNGSGSTYELQRKNGFCSGSEPWGTLGFYTTSSVTDSPVSSGYTYSYRVRSWDSTGFCVSSFSNCDDATTSGSGGCITAPAFGGLKQITTSGAETCELLLSWDPATPSCGTGVTYSVYRDTVPNFTPSEANLISTCLETNSYRDQNLIPGQTYYYIVRAEDNTTGEGGSVIGPCNQGNQDSNTKVLSGNTGGGGPTLDDPVPCPPTPDNDISSGGGPTLTWQQHSDAGAHTGGCDWFASGPASVNDQWIATRSFLVPPHAYLTFWHYYDLERGSNLTAYDGGVLEISTDGGNTWVDLGAKILTGGYNAIISSSFSNPLAGRSAWSGTYDGVYFQMKKVVVDLSAYANQLVQVRWRLGSDSSVASNGWHIDDIQVFGTVSDDMESLSANWESQAANGNIADDYWMLVRDGLNIPGDEHSWYGMDVDFSNDDYLITSPVVIPSTNPRLTFWHHYLLEEGWDGAQIWISTDGGNTWTNLGDPNNDNDISDSLILSGNGYNWILGNGCLSDPNPIASMAAWSGDSLGWQWVEVDISSWANQTALFLFRLGTDCTNLDPSDGWYIDDVAIQSGDGTVITFFDDLEHLSPGWETTTGSGDYADDWWVLVNLDIAPSPTHVWYAFDVDYVNDNALVTKPFKIPPSATLTFQHNYWLESDLDYGGSSALGYDGAVLELSVDGGNTWIDLGPYITSGGYTSTIATGYQNPLAGRSAWSGDTGATMVGVTVDLSSFSGNEGRLRFRIGCDESVGFEGRAWMIDDVKVIGTASCQSSLPPGEVSSTPSGFPFFVYKGSNSGTLKFRWQPLGGEATGYNLYEGFIGSYYSHYHLLCHREVSSQTPCPDGYACPEGGYLVMDNILPGSSGNTYYLISASNPAGEGPVGEDSLGNPRPGVVNGTPCGGKP